ncbi:hypothetical protein Btru_061439 [Bulinus truncatus]|nr:hypothetical protein Btru_061439 [Bulinus truncatus]
MLLCPDAALQEVKYYNTKKVVIDKDMEDMSNETVESIKQTITYLPTEPMWNFKGEGQRPKLNPNVTSVHVPTNIYDKYIPFYTNSGEINGTSKGNQQL